MTEKTSRLLGVLETIVAKILVPEPARSSEGAVTCSDLICELEAALHHLHAEMDSAKQTEQPESEDVRTAIWAVRQAIATKRGRSQIGEHSNTPEPRP